VSITVKGSTTGTNTDNDGNFSINAAPNSVLSFSFIGYEPQEVKVGNKSVINVSMEQSSAILDEVIVTTFGTAKKESFTGSAGQIGAQQIAVRPITNIGQAIAGTTAGVTTTAGSGQPGTAPEIRIRGFGSISSSNDPLYVVDGVPYSASIANLNPDDIATITILKDAASTALYG
ncbi:MAG: TonB-dependent receptor plug domain-containing protein, partial [Spirosomaceae bacterium]|nr:TonB-dependent receptor plug domain-containing protein [Spirosomataceae bacterium]